MSMFRFGFVLALCGGLYGQDEAQPPPQDDSVHLAIEVLEEGERQPRVAATDGEPAVAAFRLEGRRIEWQLEGKSFTDPLLVQQALTALTNDPRRRVPDPRNPGKTRIAPFVLEPSERCRWNEVVQSLEFAIAARFEELAVPGFAPHPWRWATYVAEPVQQEGAQVAPRARYGVRDLADPEVFRSVVHVSQAGVVRMGEEVVVRPGEPEEVDRLTPRLAEQVERAFEADGLVEQAPDDPASPPRLQADLLIHADLWAPWPVVRRVVEAAYRVEPAFFRVHYAVARQDHEALLNNGERR